LVVDITGTKDAMNQTTAQATRAVEMITCLRDIVDDPHPKIRNGACTEVRRSTAADGLPFCCCCDCFQDAAVIILSLLQRWRGAVTNLTRPERNNEIDLAEQQIVKALRSSPWYMFLVPALLSLLIALFAPAILADTRPEYGYWAMMWIVARLGFFVWVLPNPILVVQQHGPGVSRLLVYWPKAVTSTHGRRRAKVGIATGLIVDKAGFSVQAYRVLSSGHAILEE
jgi:hypothetical protein